jgi:ribosomal protein S18 acetylase RimI-like enzyme
MDGNFERNSQDSMTNIRKYQHQDKSSLVELWRSVFPNAPPHNEPSGVIDEKLAVDDLIFVAEDNGSIIGACMAGYDGHRGWLYAVGVLPEYRRKHIGTQLVAFAMQALRSLGCKKVNLQIRSTNTQVASFYQSLGFAAEDRLSMGAFIK